MRILLAEDNQESRESLATFITRLGHEVIECADGETAWQTLQATPCSLVLSDIQMPYLDGQELLRRIKGSPQCASTEVVLFTGYGNIQSAVDAMREGAAEYLLKPINVEELSILIERIDSLLTLRNEHADLQEHFDERVDEATRDMALSLAEARQAMARMAGSTRIGVHSNAMVELINTARRLRANPDLPVLITGETGTGKELLARFIHFGEGENTAPFVAINCAALNPNIFESELFGYEAGAFTGGNPRGQAGKLEMARGGSLFLDEISEMTPDLQAKLLRVIQEREFYRVGGVRKLKAELRIIAASNRDLGIEVARGTFRQDLFFRLNVGLLQIPPLRNQPEAILGLAEQFLLEHFQDRRTHFQTFAADARTALTAHRWPGNVRELRNVIDRMVLLHDGEQVEARHLDFISGTQKHEGGGPLPDAGKVSLPADGFDLDQHTLELVKHALEMHKGNRSKTARYLGISRSMLYTYMKKLPGGGGIRPD